MVYHVSFDGDHQFILRTQSESSDYILMRALNKFLASIGASIRALELDDVDKHIAKLQGKSIQLFTVEYCEPPVMECKVLIVKDMEYCPHSKQYYARYYGVIGTKKSECFLVRKLKGFL